MLDLLETRAGGATGGDQVHKNYIDGRFVESEAAPIKVINPANGKGISEIPNSPKATVDAAVAAAKKAQPAWANSRPNRARRTSGR